MPGQRVGALGQEDSQLGPRRQGSARRGASGARAISGTSSGLRSKSLGVSGARDRPRVPSGSGRRQPNDGNRARKTAAKLRRRCHAWRTIALESEAGIAPRRAGRHVWRKPRANHDNVHFPGEPWRGSHPRRRSGAVEPSSPDPLRPGAGLALAAIGMWTGGAMAASVLELSTR